MSPLLVFPMKSILLAFVSFLLAATAHAQWKTTTYTLKGGWNAIYLRGDVPQDSLEDLFPAAVIEVWRWNTNPDQVQFTQSPLIPSAGTPDWSVWKRGLPEESSLSKLIGQSAYLVRCSGSSANSYSVSLKQSLKMPAGSWVRNGANLLGFPSYKNGSSFPTFSSYFATFPAAIASNAKIFKYVGGDLGAGNPLQVFSPNNERLDATQAYWFSAEVVGNFVAPLEVRTSTANGLSFGRSGSVITVRVQNRTAAAVGVTFTPEMSEAAPTGQTEVAGMVPLTRRTFNAVSNQWTETGFVSSFTEAIGPSGSLELSFGIYRAGEGMTAAAAEALFASFVRVTDSASLMDVWVPVTARKSSLAGLWLGDAVVSGVESKTAGYTGTATAQTYSLRYIVHVDDAGNARMLSQVFLGLLAGESPQPGICTLESGLGVADKASARRMVSAHMPLDRVLDGGIMALGGSMNCTISTPFNDPTSPFVHQFHPDHDNKSGITALVSGQESYDLSRAVTFDISATAPEGVSSAGYGSNIIAGGYTEVLSGLRKDSVTVTGSFTLHRVSEIGTLSQ